MNRGDRRSWLQRIQQRESKNEEGSEAEED